MDDGVTLGMIVLLCCVVILCLSTSSALILRVKNKNASSSSSSSKLQQQQQQQQVVVKSPVYGRADSSAGTMGEIWLSRGRYGDKGTSLMDSMKWTDTEGKQYPGGGDRITPQGQAKATAVLSKVTKANGGEYRCQPGDWVRQFTLYSEDGYTVNGIAGDCHNVPTQTTYPLVDSVSKFFPHSVDATRERAIKEAGRSALSWTIASNVAGRGNKTKSGIAQILGTIGDVAAAAVNGLSGMVGAPAIPKTKNMSYFPFQNLDAGGSGFTSVQTWSEGADKNFNPPKKTLRALKFTTADGRSLGPVGTSSGEFKGKRLGKIISQKYTCPNGTVIVGITPKIAKDAKDERNTDLVGLSVTCAKVTSP